jgi:hypothetical protein
VNATRSVERYVAGRMDEEEERKFEELILAQPDIAAEVDAHRRIKAGLERLEEHGELQELLGRPVRPNYVKYALAASVLVAIVATAVFWRSSSDATAPTLATSLAELYGVDANPGISGTYLLASHRSRAEETVITAIRGAGAIRLQAVADATNATAFAVSLARIAGNSPTSLAQSVLSRNADRGMVEIFLDPGSLGAGRYRLRLTPQGVAAPGTDEYTFVLNLE